MWHRRVFKMFLYHVIRSVTFFTEDVGAVPVIKKAIISLCGRGIRQLSQHQLQAPLLPISQTPL